MSIDYLANNGTVVVPLFEQEQDCKKQFIALLPQGTVVDCGYIVTQDGYLLEDTWIGFSKKHWIFDEDKNIKQELFFNGKLAVIASVGSENWYHWLIQILPRLILLQKSGIEYDHIYVYNMRYSWQLKSLQKVLHHLDIPENKLLIINGDNIAIQASTLIVPSVPFMPIKDDPLPSWLIKELRHIFLETNQSLYEKYDKIYISRSNAQIRRLTNEAELIESLQAIGFKIIYLEELASSQQAFLFNKAKFIVGLHGSGFANLIFTNPGCKIIEIDHGLNSVDQRSFFKHLAHMMFCNYYPFYIDQVSDDLLDTDMKMNTAEFISFLKRIIEKND